MTRCTSKELVGRLARLRNPIWKRSSRRDRALYCAGSTWISDPPGIESCGWWMIWLNIKTGQDIELKSKLIHMKRMFQLNTVNRFRTSASYISPDMKEVCLSESNFGKKESGPMISKLSTMLTLLLWNAPNAPTIGSYDITLCKNISKDSKY